MRAEIDLNVRIGRGMTFVGFEDITPAGELPEPGEVIVVGESESRAMGAALVLSLDHDTELIYLSISWRSLWIPPDADELADLVRRVRMRERS